MRHFTTLVWFLVCALCCDYAPAQYYGDYTNDGAIDGADFFWFGGCMTGPGGGAPAGGCLAFDFDIDMQFGPDGVVDMQDFAAFQRAAPRQEGVCTGSEEKRYYTWAKKPLSGVTACGALMRTRIDQIQLCESPAVDPAMSNAHAAVGNPTVIPPENIWAEVGYIKYRDDDDTNTYVALYAGVQYGPDPPPDPPYDNWHIEYVPEWPPDSGFLVPEEGLHNYSCSLQSGIWTFDYDFGFPYGSIHSFDDPLPHWENNTGTYYGWTTEIFNKEDDMPGDSALKCDFEFLMHKEGGAGWIQDTIEGWNLWSDDEAQWGIKLTGPQPYESFEVWDKDPNP